MKSVSVTNLAFLRNYNEKITLIDVRSAEEYQRRHIEGSHLLPLSEIRAPAVRELTAHYDGEIYVICEGGYRALLAIERIESEGIENAVLVEGGIQAWVEAHLPVIQGKVPARIPRKVAIILEALLFLVGVILGMTVHYCFLLAALGLSFGLSIYHGGKTELFATGDTTSHATS